MLRTHPCTRDMATLSFARQPRRPRIAQEGRKVRMLRRVLTQLQSGGEERFSTSKPWNGMVQAAAPAADASADSGPAGRSPSPWSL
jgi:hypothetical protein